MNLRTELSRLVRALEAKGIPYALCGGLALAVHGQPRATLDIDLLVEENSIRHVKEIAHSLGFTHDSGAVTFSEGRVKLHRLVKTHGEDFIPLDLLVVTPDLKVVWQSRKTVMTEDGPICVVSKEGLIQMKQLRGSGTDQDDIRKLKGESDGAY